MTSGHDGFVEVAGVRLHHLRTGGTGTPVVLLHGLMGSGAGWSPVARALADEFDVVMPDARGHGRSSAPEHGYGYDDLAADVVGLIRALGLPQPILVGHSMGGMTAAVAAVRMRSGLRGLVLVDPTFLEPERQREVWESDVAADHEVARARSQAELVADGRARHPHRSPEVVEHQARARRATSPHALAVLAPPNPDFRALVRSLAVPTRLVVGDSTIVSRALAAELAGLNPHLDVAVVPGAGHALPFDQPEAVAAEVAAFGHRLG